jgi:hypothetical protein
MSTNLNYHCPGCRTKNAIEASAANVPLNLIVNCSKCGAFLGTWGDLTHAGSVVWLSDTDPDKPGAD